MPGNFDEREKKVDINIATSGDNTLIPAPGVGSYIAIDFISFIPTTAVAVQFKDGVTNYGGPLPLAAQQALTWENSEAMECGIITCSDNTAFVMNLGGNVQVGGLIRYRIVGY